MILLHEPPYNHLSKDGPYSRGKEDICGSLEVGGIEAKKKKLLSFVKNL